MKAARINEVERLFRQITRGSRHLNIKDLEKFIKQPVDPGAIPIRHNDNGDPLPITLSDFKESYKLELQRYVKYKENIEEELRSLQQKHDQHQNEYQKAVDSEIINENGIAEDSSLEIIVEQARDLPAMNTNNTSDSFFLVVIDKEQIHRSQTIQDTNNPVWNERLSLPIDSPDTEIDIEVWDDDDEPELIGKVFIDLDTLADQFIHNRWYELYGLENTKTGEIKLTLQWIHSMIDFHEETLNRIEDTIGRNKELLDEVQTIIKDMNTANGAQLLKSWFKWLPAIDSSDDSKGGSGYLSVDESIITSRLTTPKMTPKNPIRPSDFMQPIIYTDSQEDFSDSFEIRKVNFDFFSFGLFRMTRVG